MVEANRFITYFQPLSTLTLLYSKLADFLSKEGCFFCPDEHINVCRGKNGLYRLYSYTVSCLIMRIPASAVMTGWRNNVFAGK